MKFIFFFFLYFSLLFLQSCKEDITPNDLGSIIEGDFRGLLKMGSDTIDDNFLVQLVRLSETSVTLSSSECDEIEVVLEGDGTLAILGNADTLTSFGYTVDDESLKFLVSSPGVFKVFEGNKE